MTTIHCDAGQPAAPPLAELDQLIAAHAFARAAAAFTDAAAAARDHRHGKARKLAAEAADHLATAERAQHGLGFRSWSPKDPPPKDPPAQPPGRTPAR